MNFALFCHSILSDWNHGNAHFLRGVVSELEGRGHRVRVFEPDDAWSMQNLVADHGPSAVDEVRRRFPHLEPEVYSLASLDLDQALDGMDAILVHEWNDVDLVRRLGRYRAQRPDCRLLFHDTHHRAVTDPRAMERYDLSHYDGVLAFGRILRDLYLERGWAARAWTWHEAADTCVFRPVPPASAEKPTGDVVWIGNFGDDERTAELAEFLLRPVVEQRLTAKAYGVRYPENALAALRGAGVEYGGWLPNHHAPQVFACYRATVHIPRRPYVDVLPGIPTIRVFEALASGIPLVSTLWNDVEGLFTPGEDFLVAKDGREMGDHLSALAKDRAMAEAVAAHGLETIRTRHTCAHRVDELLAILAELGKVAS